jgi:hypothetical protein
VVKEDLGDLSVGEVGADVDVLGVHPVAHGLAFAAGSQFDPEVVRALVAALGNAPTRHSELATAHTQPDPARLLATAG